ncbi:MAG: FG-GAP-like repeat-containing protein [Flavisolibacter sp.]
MKSCLCFLLRLLLLTNALSAQPLIQNFSPASGTVGITITLKGRGFDPIASHNIIFFGAVRATILTSTDTTIQVSVPSGATYEPITVTTSLGTGYSPLPFLVTFPPGGVPSFTPASFLPKTDFTSGIYPHCVSLADFNNDGKPDLLVTKGSSSTVSLFTNASATGAVVSFAGPLEITASGNNHEASAIGDLDGDGKLDFVMTNSFGENSISVYRNTTTGSSISFAAKLDLPAINGPYSVAIGDLDGNGKPDIAVANNGSDRICLYKNKSTPGSLSFDTRSDLVAGTNPYSVIIGDLDGDNKPELVYTTQGSGSALSIMKNLSSGDTIRFDSPIQLGILSGPFVVAMGDLDGDGRPDLVGAAAGSNAVMVKRNLSTPGNIDFSGQQLYFATGNYPVGVIISDLDGDGKPDLATSNRFSNDVSILKNTSTTGNISFNNPVGLGVGDVPIFVTAGDLNGDQRPEIITANSSSDFVSVLSNIIGSSITPTIQSFTPLSGVRNTTVTIKGSNFTGATGVSFGGVNAASFTVDSDTTITAVVGQGNSGDVSVTTPKGTISMAGFNFLGPIISSFSPTTAVSGTTLSIHGNNFTNASSVSFGGIPALSFTVNNATLITAVVGNGASGDVVVTTPNGTATLGGFSFGVPTISQVNPLSAPAGSLVTISGTHFGSTPGENTVFFGAVKAMVTSASPTQLTVTVPFGATYKAPTVTVNRLTAYAPLPFSTSFVSDSTTITITPASFSNAGDYGTGNYPVGVVMIDLNDDGKPELVSVNSLGNNISILKNSSTTGNPVFLQKMDLAAGPDPKKLAVGDLDGDGKPEIVVVNFNAGNASTISVFRNTSTGSTISFAPKTDYATGNGTIGLDITDINGDGKPDIMTCSGNSGFFSIFQNATPPGGALSFSPRQDITTPGHGDNLVLADLDKDGKPDIIITDFSSSSISVYRNNSSGGYLLLDGRLSFSTGPNPSFLETADLDGDNRLDIMVSNGNSVSVFTNNSSPGFISLVNALNLNLNATNAAGSDLNGDGKPDICLGRALTGNISLLENNQSTVGAPSFGKNVDFKTGNYDSFIASGDLDGDGKPDLAATNTLLNTVTIFSNRIGAPVITQVSSTTAGTADTLSITGSNFKGVTSVKLGGTPVSSFKVYAEGRIDLVVAGGASGSISVTTPLGTTNFPGFQFIPSVTAKGPTSFCNGGSVNLISSADSGNQWFRNNTIIPGAQSKALQASTSGNYTVKTTSNGITTSSNQGMDVTVTTIPAPVITRTGNSLVSSAQSGNQWFLDGTPIPGAKDPTYQASQKGSYSVQQTLGTCTSDLSPAYPFEATGMINLGNGQFITIYPNPVRQSLLINYQVDGISTLDLEFCDLNGRRIRLANNVRAGSLVDLSDLTPGVYLIKPLSTLRSFKSIKMIKAQK